MALLSGLSTLPGAATYTAAELDSALANSGLPGIVASASEGTGGITQTIAAAASATTAVALTLGLDAPGVYIGTDGDNTLNSRNNNDH